MDDVLGQVVIAIGDENLLAGDQIALAVRHGTTAQGAHIRSGLGLGQVHGAGPGAADQLRQICLALGRTAMGGDRLDRTLGQQRAERKGKIGRTPHLLKRDRQRPGQALAAIGRIEGERAPAAGDEFFIGGPEALGCRHHAVFQPATLAVADGIQRGKLARRKLAALGKNGAHQIRRELGKIGQRHQPGQIGEFLEAKADVGERRAVGCHGMMLREPRAAIHQRLIVLSQFSLRRESGAPSLSESKIHRSV